MGMLGRSDLFYFTLIYFLFFYFFVFGFFENQRSMVVFDLSVFEGNKIEFIIEFALREIFYWVKLFLLSRIFIG